MRFKLFTKQNTGRSHNVLEIRNLNRVISSALQRYIAIEFIANRANLVNLLTIVKINGMFCKKNDIVKYFFNITVIE